LLAELDAYNCAQTKSGYNDAMKSFDDASGLSAHPRAATDFTAAHPTEKTPPATKPALSTLVGRALRLRCPACGRGRLFRKGLLMHPQCLSCGFRFEREPGYWLGSIYVNYGLTALIVTVGYFALFFSELLEPNHILWLLTAFCVLFPLWFFRYARAIWVAVDLYFDPAQADEFAPQNSAPDRE
jgi:uncharacterized protein (DUF983 family)